MKCLLDLDGVLADFHAHWHAHNPQYKYKYPNGTWSIAEVYGITWEESCRCLDNLEFWETIPWMPDGKEILALLESTFGKEICLLTSNQVDRADIAAMGKVRWIEREMPEYRNRYFLGANKHFLAHSGTVLIDDKGSNVEQFVNEGGCGILVPRDWNGDCRMADNALATLETRLRLWGLC